LAGDSPSLNKPQSKKGNGRGIKKSGRKVQKTDLHSIESAGFRGKGEAP